MKMTNIVISEFKWNCIKRNHFLRRLWLANWNENILRYVLQWLYNLKIKMSIRMERYYGASILTTIMIGQLKWKCIMDNLFLPWLWLVNWNGNVLWIIPSYHDCDWSIRMEWYYWYSFLINSNLNFVGAIELIQYNLWRKLYDFK